MQRKVINIGIGPFSLSEEAFAKLFEYPKFHWGYMEVFKFDGANVANYSRLHRERYLTLYVDRDDSILLKIVEEMGKKAGPPGSNLKIVEVPDDMLLIIESFGGVDRISFKGTDFQRFLKECIIKDLKEE